MSLNVSAILPRRPSSSPVIRTEKSPARIARSACRRLCNSMGERGSGLSSLGLPERFFVGTPLATFLLVTVVGCIDASRITRLHPPRMRAAGAIGGDKVRTARSAPDQLEAALPCLFAIYWDRTLVRPITPEDPARLKRPPAIKSAKPAKVPLGRCDIR